MIKHKTREEWLEAAAVATHPLFEEAGYKVPAVRVSCGWPSSRGTSSRNQAVGECWDKSASTDKVAQIFISPILDNPMGGDGVLSTLVHEIVHAVVGNDAGHKAPFIKCGKAVGLEGKPTEMEAGKELLLKLEPIYKGLGDYPHGRIKPADAKTPKQTTRLLKCQCPKCEYTARVTQKWLDEAGGPICPTCTVELEHEEEEA